MLESLKSPQGTLTVTRTLTPSRSTSLTAVRIECAGIKPMIQDAYDDEAEQRPGPSQGRRSRKKAVSPPAAVVPHAIRREICERKLYRGPQGELGFPTEVLMACLVAGGRHIEIVKKRPLSAEYDSLVPACVRIVEPYIVFPEDSQAWVPDPRKAESGIVFRPRFDQWRFSCTLEIQEAAAEGLMLDHIIQLVRVSGRREGIGSFRHSNFKLFPNQRWQPAIFGAFRLIKWGKCE